MSIYTDAIQHYGPRHQLRKATEELAELIVALNHYAEGRDNAHAEVVGELADCRIMMGQLEIVLDCEREVTEEMGRKLVRLDGRIRSERARGGTDGTAPCN